MFRLIKLIKSFGYAANGILMLIKLEQNARIHLSATVAVIACGLFVGLNRYEWLGVCAAIGLVWSAEAFNTAVEKLVDLVSPERQPRAGLIKDIAAAGVLICAIVAVVIALLVFIPHIIK